MISIKELLPTIIIDLENAIKTNDFNLFQGLRIDRRKPHTLRLFYFKDGLRVCLHIFDPCDWEDAFPHPHNWDSEVLIVDGEYRHWISERTPLNERADENKGFVHILGAGSSYRIDNPYLWHRVQPLTQTMTIMINGKEWEKKSEFSVTTKGKELVELSEQEKREIIERFLNKLS